MSPPQGLYMISTAPSHTPNFCLSPHLHLHLLNSVPALISLCPYPHTSSQALSHNLLDTSPYSAPHTTVFKADWIPLPFYDAHMPARELVPAVSVPAPATFNRWEEGHRLSPPVALGWSRLSCPVGMMHTGRPAITCMLSG